MGFLGGPLHCVYNAINSLLPGHPAWAAREKNWSRMDLNMGRLEVSEINKIVLEEEELLSCYRKLSTGLQHTKTFATSGYTPQTNNNESEAGSKSPNS